MNSVSILDLVVRIGLGIALALWFYRDARGRDFSWPVWTMSPVVIIFFPRFSWLIPGIVLPVIYLAARPKGKMGPCPHCKKRITDELAFCPFCRRSVKRECLKCHETVPWDATICPHCHCTALTDS